MKRRTGYNPKRKLEPADRLTMEQRQALAVRVVYKGNPEHKVNPNEYGLPPTNPRPGKTLCDEYGAFPKSRAEVLLRDGVRRGMVSAQWRSDLPQNIWSVDEKGDPYEAQLENVVQGHYHGYPMPADDDFRKTVLQEWERRNHDLVD